MSHRDVLIVINSSNRAGKIRTNSMFPARANYVIAIPEEQYGDYSSIHGDSRLIPVPKQYKYLPSQRQYVMEWAHTKGIKFIWFMDDDLTFFTRKDLASTKLTKCDEDDIATMICCMQRELKNYPLVGISTRLGNNFVTEYSDTIGRVTRCYALNVEVFKQVGAVFNPIEPFVAEDFHITLCFLNAGHPNAIIYAFAQEDVGSNAPGGCSFYRTAEVQKTTMEWMAANHPEVTVKLKQNKTGWNLPGSTDNIRVDCIVQWKKAYKPRRIGGLNKLFAKKGK